jgi:PKD repeat protein
MFCVLALLSLSSAIACRPAPPAITVFTATPAEIKQGKSTTLKWAIKDATSVTIDQGIGEVASEGSAVLSPAKTIAYTLTATNAGGTVSKSVVITVNVPLAPPPPPPPDTTALEIKNISASSDTGTEAVVTWATDKPSSGQVEYGKTPQYGLTATSDELTTTHSIILSLLEPDTTYH